MSKELFKNAIAEAKSVREAAIANAKEALEETITPHLKELLAAKLQEMDEVEEEVMEEEVVEETIEEADGLEEVEVAEAEEDDAEEAADDSEEDHSEEDHSEEDHSEGEPEGDEDLGDISVEQFKDLVRDIIADEMAAGEEEEMELPADVQGMGDEEMEEPIDDMSDDEEIDLDEMLNEILAEEEIEEEVSEEVSEEVEEGSHDKDKMEEELKEALETINTLRQDLQEVNLLNSKLLYVNKVFKANNLTESQKANVIAAFDKAENVKEVKLVFETVSENVVSKQASKPVRSVNESKLGSASKATGTTARRPQIISESDQAVLRMQKLAGIIKN